MQHIPFTLAAFLATSIAHADTVGLRLMEIAMPHHGRATDASIFYPTMADGEPRVFAENPVFHGVAGLQDAPLSPGEHPLVLLSHGMGGGIQSVAWLAHGLAERGAIVVSVNHINTTWSAFDLPEGVKHWTRAQDFSTALDLVLPDADLGAKVDPDRIMAAGFSYGGWTALSLGGARGNHSSILSICSNEVPLIYCDAFQSEAVDLAGIDPEVWNASYRDARVTHVAALDPGFVWGIEAADLSDLIADVSLMGFGAGEDRLIDTDFDASGFVDHVPGAQIERIVPGTHFVAMPMCKPAGEAILESENDDPVCTDPKGADRAQIHRRIIDSMAAQLGL